MRQRSRRPLKPHWLHILIALSEQDLHGSGIARSVLEQTDGDLRLWPATLYGALEELCGEGLIRELTGDEHPDDASAKRRYYSIEPPGREALMAEGERLSSLARLALDGGSGA